MTPLFLLTRMQLIGAIQYKKKIRKKLITPKSLQHIPFCDPCTWVVNERSTRDTVGIQFRLVVGTAAEWMMSHPQLSQCLALCFAKTKDLHWYSRDELFESLSDEIRMQIQRFNFIHGSLWIARCCCCWFSSAKKSFHSKSKKKKTTFCLPVDEKTLHFDDGLRRRAVNEWIRDLVYPHIHPPYVSREWKK